jgi:hypothetical protein
MTVHVIQRMAWVLSDIPDFGNIALAYDEFHPPQWVTLKSNVQVVFL